MTCTRCEERPLARHTRGREICELQAESAEAAIKRTIRQHGIDGERAKRLAAYRVVPRCG